MKRARAGDIVRKGRDDHVGAEPRAPRLQADGGDQEARGDGLEVGTALQRDRDQPAERGLLHADLAAAGVDLALRVPVRELWHPRNAAGAVGHLDAAPGEFVKVWGVVFGSHRSSPFIGWTSAPSM